MSAPQPHPEERAHELPEDMAAPHHQQQQGITNPDPAVAGPDAAVHQQQTRQPDDEPPAVAAAATEIQLPGGGGSDDLRPDGSEVPVAPGTSEPGSAGDEAPQEPDAMDGYSVGLSVDTDTSETDSSLGDLDSASTTKSVNSSVYEFVEEFGRTYHRYKEGKYYLPNDEQEQNRLDLQHAIMKRLLKDKLGLAPVGAGTQRVLDIGTGTGIWAIEFAEQHPEADVLGTDLSPIQPDYVPPNCHFEIDDIEDEWIWNYQFSYVHGRYIVPFLRDVPLLLKNIYDHLSPGGFVEFQESPMLFHSVDDSLEGTTMKRWNDNMLEAVRRIGRDPMVALKLHDQLRDAGFVNIAEQRIPLPIGPWPKGRDRKIIGAMEMTNLLNAAHGITMSVFTRALGWSEQEVEVLLVDARKDLQDKRIHAYLPVVVIYAQKPLETTQS